MTPEEILNDIKESKLGLIDIIHQKSLALLSKDEELKINAFRFVDVFPSLRSSSEVSKILRAYLSEPLNRTYPILGKLLILSTMPGVSLITKSLVSCGITILASRVIAGRTAKDAISKLQKILDHGQGFTVDLLGEYCVSENEAEIYKDRYLEVLNSLSKKFRMTSDRPGVPLCISVKLSALYSQTDYLNFDKSVEVISSRAKEIVTRAEEVGAQVYIDAEDTATNQIIYAVFEKLFCEDCPKIKYPGIVLQCYLKDSTSTFNRLKEMAIKRGSPIAVRLVKGAYWDVERALAIQNGFEIPVFETKRETDKNFEVLSDKLVENSEYFMPGFAGHNVQSLSYGINLAKRKGIDFEVQTLYGMADSLSNALSKRGVFVRQYVPIGELIPGMGYLVRRLVENTSNEGFLRSLWDV